MSECCERAYLDDQFCVECGDEITKSNRAVNDDDISEILSKMRSVYPLAKIITGIVERTFLYQRRYKKSGDHSRDETYSFWWVTIKTAKGKVVSYSVEAEDEDVDSIKKGDLISFIVTKSVHLVHPFLNRKDKKTVVHNNLSATTVFHKNKNLAGSGFYTITDYLEPKKYTVLDLIGITFLISLGTFFIEYLLVINFGVPDIPSKIMEFITENIISSYSDFFQFWLLFPLLLLLILVFTSQLMYWREESVYEMLRGSSKKILNAYSSGSSFDNMIRPSSDSDVSCHSCNKFIDVSADYCNYCSSSMEGGVGLSRSSDSISRIDYINEEYRALFSSWNQRYVYSHVMVPNEKGEVESDIYLAKVVNKDIDISASRLSSSSTYRTTTTYTNFYNIKVGESHKDRPVSHVYRKSKVTGSIEISISGQESIELKVPTDALRSIDIDDWLLIGVSRLNFKSGDRYSYNELTYNISKDIKTEGWSLSDFGYTSPLSIAIFIISIGTGIFLHYKDLVTEGQLIMTLLPFVAIVMSWTLFNMLRNKMAKRRIVKKFKSAYKECVKKRGDILKSVG
jgi:hypothetical protein